MKDKNLTHGLLVEDFKNKIMSLLSTHELDIQTKAIILDYINIQIQNISAQQTSLEYEKYKNTQNGNKTCDNNKTTDNNINN